MRPADEHPVEAAALKEWWAARAAWDSHVIRLRRYQVARSLDLLNAPDWDDLRPEQVIAAALGASWLDGTLSPAGLGGLFGGPL